MNGLKHSSEPRRYRSRLLGLLGSLLLALQSGSGFAQEAVYTWKDAAGRVHYGNRPPEGQPVVPVDLNANPVNVQSTERIYTWTDADGKIHYGPQPPPDTPARELKEDDTSLSTIHSGKLRSGEQQLLQNPQRRP